ncbi:MAG: hypothetical protein RR295_06235, partial [Oscillospiraceae bacterium]
MKAIVYASKAGHTAHYAQLLSQRTGLPALSLEEAKKTLHHGEEIFFMGWVFAATLKGWDVAKHYTVRGIAACGMNDPNGTDVAELRKWCGVTDDVKLFYLRGGLEIKKLHGVNRIIMQYLRKTMTDQISAKATQTSEEQFMLRMLEEGVDCVREENLSE